MCRRLISARIGFTELGVQCAQWLVHQEGSRPPHQGTRQRYTLLVTAAQLARALIQECSMRSSLATSRTCCRYVFADSPWACRGKAIFFQAEICG